MEFEDGFRPPVVFERKSKGDLWGTLTNGAKGKIQNYTRFKRELERAKEANTTVFFILEGSYTAINKDYKYSKRKAISIIKQIHTMHIRYGLQPIFCTTRDEMAKYITNFYVSFGEGYAAKLKEEKRKGVKT